MSSSSSSLATYDHDDIESDQGGYFVLKNDVKGRIEPDTHWNHDILREPDALSYTEFEKVWPSLAKEYKTIVEHFSDQYTPAFPRFRFRFSRPTEGKRLPFESSRSYPCLFFARFSYAFTPAKC